jgi:hypothetical protein
VAVVPPLGKSIKSLDCLDLYRCSSAECCEPRALSVLELAEDSRLEVDNRNYPFVLIFGAIVGCCQYSDICLSDFLPVQVLHFVITSYKHPTISVAKLDDFGIRHVPQRLAFCIPKPLRKPLNSEPRCPESSCDRLR